MDFFKAGALEAFPGGISGFLISVGANLYAIILVCLRRKDERGKFFLLQARGKFQRIRLPSSTLPLAMCKCRREQAGHSPTWQGSPGCSGSCRSLHQHRLALVRGGWHRKQQASSGLTGFLIVTCVIKLPIRNSAASPCLSVIRRAAAWLVRFATPRSVLGGTEFPAS